MLRAMFLLVAVLTLTACGGGGDDSRDTMPPDQEGEATFSDLVEGRSMVFTPTAAGSPFCVRFTGEWRFESWDPGTSGYQSGWYAGDFADVSDHDDMDTVSFTWDPDNDPDEYELVAHLTFASETEGVYESFYSEDDHKYPIVRGDFEIVEGHLDAADCRREDTGSNQDDMRPPDQADDPTFSALVEGQSVVLTPTEGRPFCVRFTGVWRFESYDHDTSRWYPGDYRDETEGNEMGGTLSFTWDPNNDPDEYELVVRVTFQSETAGAYESVYSEGDHEYPTVRGDFDIVEGHLDTASCQNQE